MLMFFNRRVMVTDIPKIQIHQDFPDHGRFLDKGYDLLGSPALGTKQGIHMINLLYQPSPVLPKRVGCQNRLHQGRHGVMPLEGEYTKTNEAAIQSESETHERALLYVAATHAKKQVKSGNHRPIY
jgi:hypothetical protein